MRKCRNVLRIFLQLPHRVTVASRHSSDLPATSTPSHRRFPALVRSSCNFHTESSFIPGTRQIFLQLLHRVIVYSRHSSDLPATSTPSHRLFPALVRSSCNFHTESPSIIGTRQISLQLLHRVTVCSRHSSDLPATSTPSHRLFPALVRSSCNFHTSHRLFPALVRSSCNFHTESPSIPGTRQIPTSVRPSDLHPSDI